MLLTDYLEMFKVYIAKLVVSCLYHLTIIKGVKFLFLSRDSLTCWDRADLLVLLYVGFSYVFVTFPYGILGQVWYLIVCIPDLCLLPYFRYNSIVVVCM